MSSNGRTSRHTAPRPRLLLVHSDEARRAALTSALEGYDVVGFASRDEAAIYLETLLGSRSKVEPPDPPARLLAIAEAAQAKKLVRDLDRHAPESGRVILCRSKDEVGFSALAALAAEGHLFTVLDDSLSAADVADQIGQSLRPRESIRVPPALKALVQFQLGDWLVEGVLADLSNRGLGVRIPADGPIERLALGTTVGRLVLRHESIVVLEAVSATIRHTEIVRSGKTAELRIGLTIDENSEGPPPAQIADSSKIASLILRSSQQGAPLRLEDEAGGPVELQGVTTDFSSGSRNFQGRSFGSERLQVGHILPLRFQLAGRGYSGQVAVLANESGKLTFSLPRTLQQAHRRSALRHPTAPTSPIVVSLSSPVTGQRILRRVFDHHGMGISILIDAGHEALPPGLLIGFVSLTLPNGRIFECRAQVRYTRLLKAHELRHAVGLEQPHLCGLRLLDVPDELRSSLLDVLVTSAAASIESADQVPIQEVWRLMKEAGRSYLDYPIEPGPHLEVLAHAQRGLVRAHGALGKSFVCRSDKDQRILGYASGLRLYSRTWMLQSLTVLPGFNRQETVSQKLSSLVVEYGESLEDIYFIRCMWAFETRWTHRLSTWIARQLSTAGLTHLTHVNYLHLPAGAPWAMPSLPSVRPATAADLAWIEKHFRATGELVRLRSDDWDAAELALPTLNARSQPFGLKRGRSIFVIDSGREPVAFALADHATPGLTWQESINGFRVFAADPADPRTKMASQALISRCVNEYRSRGQAYAVAFPGDADVALFEEMGFQHHGKVAEWTFHKQLVRQWQELLTAVFDRVAQGKRREERESVAA